MVRWFCVNLQCPKLIWIRVGQGPTALAVGADGGCLDIFTLVYHFLFLSPSPWETTRYRLKSCLIGPLSPKQRTNQPLKMSHHKSMLDLNAKCDTYLLINKFDLYETIVYTVMCSKTLFLFQIFSHFKHKLREKF